MRVYCKWILVAALVAVAACARTGASPLPEEASDPLSAPGEMARIYFYRDYEPYESLSRPNIYLNNDVAGVSRPGGVFYLDVQPGSYLISVDSFGIYCNQFKTTTVGPGDIRFVKIESLRSWAESEHSSPDTFVVSLMDRAHAEAEVASYVVSAR